MTTTDFQKPGFIFVTVGSTDFDELVERMDRWSKTNGMNGIAQIGKGRYEPKHIPYFRFSQSLDTYYQKASIVVAHGGLATTMEVLKRGLPLVSVSNPDRYDNHQIDILARLARDKFLIWCENLARLSEAIERAQKSRLLRYEPPPCSIHLVIRDYLKTVGKPL